MVSDKGDLAIEQESIAFNNSTATEADFQTLCTGAIFYSTAAVHLGFDGEPASSSTFLLPATTLLEVNTLKFTRISAFGNAGSGTLYILGKR